MCGIVDSSWSRCEQKGNKGNSTPLMEAACKGYVICVEFLLKAGANIDECGKIVTEQNYLSATEAQTALIYAVNSGHVNITEILIKAGANLNISNAKGNTATHVAAFKVNRNTKIYWQKQELI